VVLRVLSCSLTLRAAKAEAVLIERLQLQPDPAAPKRALTKYEQVMKLDARKFERHWISKKLPKSKFMIINDGSGELLFQATH
jgi:hypothetical protein